VLGAWKFGHEFVFRRKDLRRIVAANRPATLQLTTMKNQKLKAEILKH
jgi:hypothetical protein